MFNFAQARTNMVDSQLRPNGITDSRILDAMQSVAREQFVGSAQQSLAYMDADVPLQGAATGPRYLIEPMAFGRMLQVAEVKETDRVLDIGAATGYGAAVLSQLVAQIVALEEDAGLVEQARINLKSVDNVSLIEGELSKGAPNSGSYDLIILEGAVAEVPNALFSQIKNGGRLIAAVGSGVQAKCCVYAVSGQTHTRRVAFDITIAPLPGFAKAKAGFAF